MGKIAIGINVLEAAKNRIEYTFDNFEKIYISLSGGKDSTVMFHLVMNEAKKRNRKIGVFILDWECQFELTIKHLDELTDIYKDYIDLYWIALEVETCSACSVYEPLWRSWDKSKQNLWTRSKNIKSICDEDFFPFYYPGITFEEFTPLFGKWFSENERCACFVGIRTQESLNRYRAIAREDINRFDNKIFTTNVVDDLWNVYPIYDYAYKRR